MHFSGNYTCDICHKAYKSERTYKKHVRSHDPENHYDCHLCDNKFLSSRDRNKHLYTHPEFKPFVCTHCGKSIVSASALDIHVRMKHMTVSEVVVEV